MKKRKQIDSFIGFFATRSSVTGILMRKTESHLEVVNRFVKHRIKTEEQMAEDRFGSSGGLKSGDDSDFTLQVAATPGSGQFIPAGETQQTEQGISSINQEPTPPFLVQAREVLADARASGLTDNELSFCVAAPDINHVELSLPVEDADTDRESGVSSGTRKKLLKLLPELYTESFENERVGFIPMLTNGNVARYLAVVPVPREPVVPTLRMMALQMKSHMPRVKSVRSDITVLSALVRKSAVAAKGQRTAVVRVGTDDTMILLFEGPNLQYFERLRSITTYDSPEKVCSRIMLQQDESKIGELDNVLILSDGRLQQLVESFQSFYPDAVVEPMLSVLEEHGVRVPAEEGAGIRAGAVLAIGSVVIDALGWESEKDAAAAINLLPRKLLPKETGAFAFAWHTAAMIAVLFGVTFMAVTSYLENERTIEQRRSELMSQVPAIPVSDPALLQQKVDSLNRVHMTLTKSLGTLDSLLVGSDRWSRFLDRLTSATGNGSPVWLKDISASGAGVKITGSARSRSRIADFARDMDGAIEQLASADVRTKGGEVTIYSFTMNTSIPSEMPEVALYLRDYVMSEDDFSDLDSQQQALPAGFEATPMTDAATRRAPQ